MSKRDPRLKAFVKIDKTGQVVPGSLVLRYKKPESGSGTFTYWQEIIPDVCCTTTTTTTTTTSSTTTTTTTT